MNPMTIRRWHLYLGLLTAPSVIFFSLTGAVQLFGLHEAHDGYQPLAIVEKLSSLHKDQVFRLGNHHAGPPAAGEAVQSQEGRPPQPPDSEDSKRSSLSTSLLKSFLLVVALSLALTSSLGIWMAFTQTRSKTAAWRLLVAGALIPIGLLLL